jgi:hypothetical protein
MCNCIQKVNKELELSNAKLATSFYPNVFEERVLLESYKLNPEKWKWKATRIAKYCPFCGKKYKNYEDYGELK